MLPQNQQVFILLMKIIIFLVSILLIIYLIDIKFLGGYLKEATDN
jgi:hypothetical protein